LRRCLIAALLSILSSPALSQDAESLVREAKNPFADVANLQFIYDATLDSRNPAAQTVTFQPLIPFEVSPTWSIITRTILPFIDQPGTATGEGRTHGVGDTQFSAFLSPTRTGSLVWGVGPVLQLPTVNQMQLQPEINYTFKRDPNGYLTFSPTITANWQASGNGRWTVPVSLGIGQLVKLGAQALNLQATAYYNVAAPAGTAPWTLEMELQILFPK